MTTRAYIRESTVAQGEKFGPDAQRVAIDRACDDLKIARAQLWYADLITGTGKVVRDGLAQARAAAAAHEFDVLVCYDTSRWARNEREAFDFEHEMKLAGVRIYYAAERIWADDDAKALHKGMLHVINAEYSRSLSRRIRDGYAAKKAKGGHVGAVPTGYRREGMTLVPTDAIAPRLQAWDLYATGEHTYATVATELNRRGYRITWHGEERAFTPYTISEILSRDIDLRFGGLDPATYARAREVAARHKINEHVGQRRHEYVFPAVARCAECGESFWGRIGAHGRQLYHSPRGCRRGARSESQLEEQLGAWLATWSLDAADRVRIRRFLASRSQDDERTARRRAAETELERIRNLYRWGDMREREYLDESRRLRSALAALGPDAIAAPPSEEAMRLASKLGDAWSRASLPLRRRFVADWFSELRLNRDGSVDVVPREAVREIVFAASGRSAPWAVLDGTPRSQPPRRSTTVRVVGIDEWRSFWAAEGTA